jgi:hypothetical protein
MPYKTLSIMVCLHQQAILYKMSLEVSVSIPEFFALSLCLFLIEPSLQIVSMICP